MYFDPQHLAISPVRLSLMKSTDQEVLALAGGTSCHQPGDNGSSAFSVL
jgi:hypothetical protein